MEEQFINVPLSVGWVTYDKKEKRIYWKADFKETPMQMALKMWEEFVESKPNLPLVGLHIQRKGRLNTYRIENGFMYSLSGPRSSYYHRMDRSKIPEETYRKWLRNKEAEQKCLEEKETTVMADKVNMLNVLDRNMITSASEESNKLHLMLADGSELIIHDYEFIPTTEPVGDLAVALIQFDADKLKTEGSTLEDEFGWMHDSSISLADIKVLGNDAE